jgi:hypothetical protein
MKPVPFAPLILGLAGLIPFLWGALTLWVPGAAEWGMSKFGPRFLGPYVLLQYGTIILAFMSGVLWGFATRAEGRVAATGYALAVLPALWAFFFVGGGPVSAAIYLVFGFIGLLGLDWLFWTQGLAPAWWMTLRTGLTVVVVACLTTVIF